MATQNPKSTARIAGHPIHPMLIPFPIALFIAAFVCDIVFWQTDSAAWHTGALWMIGFGLIMAGLAAGAGFIDALGDSRIRALKDLWWHAGGNVAVVLLQLYSWIARYRDGQSAVVPQGIAISFLVTGILMFTGWKGWSMVYRHRVGVANEGDIAHEIPKARARRLASDQPVKLNR